jgi:hypothetical protein
MTEMVEAAWCILADNVDLVRWVVCLVFNESGDSAVQSIQGRGLNVEVRCSRNYGNGWWFLNNGHPCPNLAVSLPDLFGGFIHICATTQRAQEWIRVFTVGTAEERLCTAIDMATLLMHELTHVSALNNSDVHVDPCESSYVAASTFKWMLLRRYTSAKEAPCCAAAYDDSGLPNAGSLFFSDENEFYPRGVCAPEEESGISDLVYCLKYPEECADRVEIDVQDRERR